MKVLGTPFEFASFSSSFLQYMLEEDVCHVETFLSLGDVQVAFGIFQCFVQRLFYLFRCFPPLLVFRH